MVLVVNKERVGVDDNYTIASFGIGILGMVIRFHEVQNKPYRQVTKLFEGCGSAVTWSRAHTSE